MNAKNVYAVKEVFVSDVTQICLILRCIFCGFPLCVEKFALKQTQAPLFSLPYGASSSAVNFRVMSICPLQESMADCRMESDNAFYLFHQNMGTSNNGR